MPNKWWLLNRFLPRPPLNSAWSPSHGCLVLYLCHHHNNWQKSAHCVCACALIINAPVLSLLCSSCCSFFLALKLESQDFKSCLWILQVAAVMFKIHLSKAVSGKAKSPARDPWLPLLDSKAEHSWRFSGGHSSRTFFMLYFLVIF